jgi:electron transfer flavoprotein alpha subunit
VHLLVAGPASAAAEAATLHGASKVLHADDAGHGLAEGLADLVVSLAGGYSHIAAAATAYAKNVLPRVAALLDVMVLTDVTAVVDADTFERPIYAGNAIQTVKSSDKIKVFTVRTAAFAAAAAAALRRCRPWGHAFGAVVLGRGQGGGIRPPRPDQRQDRGVGRARRGVKGKL